ncbi:hypothetical protein EJ04DRAFT_172267 [Polyplosphaeria fusca]|uniref:CID domain-containing protein n=1 Tax=Polyplosphaeria fusca TaxID=682080 RepID=A0A9P4R3T5_9PLEO|nr:hypothetical protein EJ04DRAFT_172267 [Polyplosphaeria fusca]
MADPFETRLRFTSLLSSLTASHTSHTKTASFLLKNRDLDEDLHSCILETLERSNLNTRANIMYFLDALADVSAREGYQGYMRMVQRDVARIVDCVVPEGGGGSANGKVVRKVLKALESKGILLPDTVVELEAVLKAREGGAAANVQADVVNGGSARAARNGGARLDKRGIEQRIEEDRERHKRLREGIWAVSGEAEDEMERLWEEGSDIADDDYVASKEDRGERGQGVQFG